MALAIKYPKHTRTMPFFMKRSHVLWVQRLNGHFWEHVVLDCGGIGNRCICSRYDGMEQ